jgi:hypothetical protein
MVQAGAFFTSSIVLVLVLDFFGCAQMQPGGAFVHRFLSMRIAFSRQGFDDEGDWDPYDGPGSPTRSGPRRL